MDNEDYAPGYEERALTDASEFGQLIQQVVHKEIPAYIENNHVYLTNGVSLKNGGQILKEIQGPERNEPCFCGSGKKFKRCCINLIKE